MVWYARKSSDDGKGMNKGILFHEGGHYCRTVEHAKKYVESFGLVWEEELMTVNTKDEWFYFTDWEELDEDEFYDFDGNTYKLCHNCKHIIKVLLESNLCENCNTYT